MLKWRSRNDMDAVRRRLVDSWRDDLHAYDDTAVPHKATVAAHMPGARWNLAYCDPPNSSNHEDGQQKEDGTELVEQDLEILDININTKHASELDDILVQMQAIEQGKNYIGRSVQKKFTTMEEYDMYMNIYDELQGNYVKKKEQYKELVRTRHENNADFKEMPAEKRVKQVD